jgi:hypothetical protein
LILLENSLVHGMDLYVGSFLAARRVRADMGWRRASEVAADCREEKVRRGMAFGER